MAKRTSDHGGDEFFHVGFFGGFRHDELTITQDGNFVADFKNLIHFVGDVDKGNAFFAKVTHNFEKLFDFAFRERARRLIQNDDFGVVANSLSDFNHLAFANAHGAHHRFRVDVHVQPIKEGFRTL